MAGNTRGKLKEEFEGIHRDFDWCIIHCAKALALIQGHKPELSEAIEALATGISTLDELNMSIYNKL